jgi:PAS domain S-box-containing protein
MHSPDRKQLLYVSPAYEQIWGYTCESWYQEPDSWLQCLHPDDRERVIAALNKEILGTYDEEYRLLRLDGSIRWIRDRAFPIYNEQGEVYRIVGIAQDITDRKQAEVTAQALEQERELSELKSRFIAIASHEFRTPLTAIVMSAELLEKYNHKATDAQRYRHFQQIKSAVKRITQLLDDVLVVGRAEAGKLQCQPVPVDLEQFCGNIVEELQLAVGEKHQLMFTTQGADVQAYLDENLLRHILTNLLSNAIKYSPPGSRVQFDLICNSSTATFQIQDQGIGIPPADQDKLFTSFYRCSNTGKVAGTGLGLTIVQEAVELHGGQVKVESQLGVGTTFTVTLPLHPSLRTA